MQRLARAFAIAALTFGLSGLSPVVSPEPCTGYAQATQDDDSCPPTCVTCGCCAHPMEPVALAISRAADVRLTEAAPPFLRLPNAHAPAILHVPKLRLA